MKIGPKQNIKGQITFEIININYELNYYYILIWDNYSNL